MKYFVTLLFVLSASISLQAQNTAKDILDKAAAKFRSYPAAEIDFTLTMENKTENIEETHSGKAYMKGNLYKLGLMDVVNYYDGKNIYTYMPEVKEVNIKNPNEDEEEFLNPATLFDIHNQGFNQKLVGTTNGVAYIELLPTDSKRNFSKVGIWVEIPKYSIQKVTSFGKDGNDITIKLKDIKALSPAPDSFFTFDPGQHPDVDVIDMR